MNSLIENIKDSLRYSFSDWRLILTIGTIMFVISFLRKFPFENAYIATLIFIIYSLLIFLEVGFGSKIAATSIRGDTKPPRISKVPKLMWEGFKKVCIITIYGIVINYLVYHGEVYRSMGSPIFLIFFALFLFVYILLILGLINRYNYRGSFIKAFDYKEIFELFKKIKMKNLFLILACAILAHGFTIQSLLNISEGFKPIEVYCIIATFFLAPFMLITTKRFMALNVRETLHEMQKK